MLNEETYRITARNSDTCVFTYDVETELIQFLNDKYKDIGLDQEQLSIPILLEKYQQGQVRSPVQMIRNILETIENKEALPVRKKSQSGLGGQNEISADHLPPIFSMIQGLFHEWWEVLRISQTCETDMLELQTGGHYGSCRQVP